MNAWFFVRSGRPAGEIRDRDAWAVCADTPQSAISLCFSETEGEPSIEPNYEFTFAEPCSSKEEALGKVEAFYNDSW